MKMEKKLFLLFTMITLSLSIFTGCTQTPPEDDQNVSQKASSEDESTTDKQNNTNSPEEDIDVQKGAVPSVPLLILNKANTALVLLKNHDLQALSSMIHPEEGIVFSPYSYIEERVQSFSPDELVDLWDTTTVTTWGSYDGSGEPIELPFQQYYHRFIYDEDFVNADQIGYDLKIGTGNTLSNIEEQYPNGHFVEYHFPAIDPQYEGMDWRSLRLVFEPQEDQWYLVAVIHDEWTI